MSEASINVQPWTDSLFLTSFDWLKSEWKQWHYCNNLLSHNNRVHERVNVQPWTDSLTSEPYSSVETELSLEKKAFVRSFDFNQNHITKSLYYRQRTSNLVCKNCSYISESQWLLRVHIA